MTIAPEEVARLAREVRRLKLALGAAVLVGVAAMTAAAVSPPSVLRARGLVLVDAQGRERILLGAPVPASRDRNRQDAEAATASLVVLGPDGADRVVVGQTPSPVIAGQVRVRPLEGWGLALYDPEGHERGGMGVLGDRRVAVALDYPGGDAVGMFVDDRAGRAVLALNHPPSAKAPESAVEITAGGPGDPRLVMHDATGRVVHSAPDQSRYALRTTRSTSSP